MLRDPLSTHTDRAALTVGTNRWPTAAAVLEEEFLPLAVTMHNTSPRPLWGNDIRGCYALLHCLKFFEETSITYVIWLCWKRFALVRKTLDKSPTFHKCITRSKLTAAIVFPSRLP